MGDNGKKADDKARAMANRKLLKNASPANKKVITKILNEERKAKKKTPLQNIQKELDKLAALHAKEEAIVEKIEEIICDEEE